MAPPRDLEELSLRLHRLASNRRDTIADVADHAIEHPYEIAFGAGPGVASRCGVSLSSVVRLAHNLGFRGVRDMRSFYRRHLRDSRGCEDDCSSTPSSSNPTKVIHVARSIGDDGFPGVDFMSAGSGR